MRRWRAPSGEEPGEVLGGGLGDGVEQGVPAADVGLERVVHADPVAELDVVEVAGPAAVGLVGPGREEGAEDAMLHVEHRDLLVDHDLQPVRRDGREEVVELVEAQVVRGRRPAAPREP